MAKRKKIIEPIIQRGVPLPLNYSEIPEEWMPVDDFSSHRPMLYRAIMNIAHSTFIEFGTGNGSTPVLRDLYTKQFPERDLISYENDYQWFELLLTDQYQQTSLNIASYKNHYLYSDANLLSVNIWHGAILFIDCAPAELRKNLISKHCGIAKLIIVHDTEPGSDYVYGMKEMLDSFKFRCDLIVDGYPQTTIVSNLYEFDNWKTIINDQIRFV